MKSRDEIRLSCLRMLKAAIKNKEIELIQKLEDDGIFKVIVSMVKQRRESVEQFKLGNRADLVAREEKEITVLEAYLPSQLPVAEVEALVDAVIRETGAKSPKEMGQVMKAIGPKIAGRADGKTVSEIVKKKLTAL